MKDLVIIGAGNVGGFLAYNLDLFPGKYNLLGFLDDDPAKTGAEKYGRSVIGTTDLLQTLDRSTAIAIGIAYPGAKKKVYEKISHFGFAFPSFIAANAWLSHEVKIGRGVILYPGVAINYESVIGDFVIMNMNCAIGHNCKVDAFSALAPGVNLAGFTHIEEAVDMGIGSATRQQVVVGQASVIGGQSMLIRDVPPRSRIVGVPGTSMR